MARRVRTATALLTVRPRMATSMRQRTGIPTPTPGTAGRAQARTPRNTTHPATQAQAHQRPVPAGGEGRKRAADHRPSIAVGEAGSPGRPVLVVQRAGAGGVVGEAAGESGGATARESNFGEWQCGRVRQFEGLENEYVTSGPQNLFYLLVDAASFDGYVCRLQQ